MLTNARLAIGRVALSKMHIPPHQNVRLRCLDEACTSLIRLLIMIAFLSVFLSTLFFVFYIYYWKNSGLLRRKNFSKNDHEQNTQEDIEEDLKETAKMESIPSIALLAEPAVSSPITNCEALETSSLSSSSICHRPQNLEIAVVALHEQTEPTFVPRLLSDDYELANKSIEQRKLEIQRLIKRIEQARCQHEKFSNRLKSAQRITDMSPNSFTHHSCLL
ncbi:unnamed protein product [Caenorhabditis bovis]|uniref:Uncharacterized protein n=1 Tax=Caenorhabditis bovis TaxID=2654633 RepID=A0A8S1F0P3_9PELO|nr:unnamed protein product [Caenorhabditis bovis]